MVAFTSVAAFFALRLLTLTLTPTSTQAAPAPTSQNPSTYWIADIKRQGTVPFGKSDFKIYRNVKEYGAKGDGSTDDTAAINKAVADGNRCGKGCDSSTVTPALVYFPPGTYIVSKPIIQYYYTQFVGDAVKLPVLKASKAFQGMAVIDTDPYEGEINWYTNQNNFFRQTRNFVIDLTGMPASNGAGIHYQMAQATSLQNIRFEMVKGGNDNKQQGIFMDNGSGGFMSDLTFNGGNQGAFLGAQQYTMRNLTFNNCNTAVFMNWNWLWNLKSLSINNCGVGVNMSNMPENQTVGSIVLQDSEFKNTPKGIITAYNAKSNVPTTGNTLIVDNVDFSGSEVAVMDVKGATILKGGSKIESWVQGRGYTTGGKEDSTTCDASKPTAAAHQVQQALKGQKKPANLLKDGKFFERSKPQYENVPSSSFVSIKSAGAKGDGKTDDSDAIQKAMDSLKSDQILYFDHGNYIVTKTIKVPKEIKITGEIWPVIMATGKTFSDVSSPVPLFQVGQSGDSGAVEMSDIILTTKGPAPGAILMEWNLGEKSQGSNGIWDVHFRIGGFAGTDLQSDTCAKDPKVKTTAETVKKCTGAFLSLHITSKGALYAENTWYWVADHELDLPDHKQINIFSGRGVLIESTEGPVWLYGTSSEHHQLYNYQIANAKNVYMGIIQTETPYMQANPTALSGGFAPDKKYSDPDFSECKTDLCRKAWGLRVVGSKDVHVYGAGLYSFFENYGQECLKGEECQEHMLDISCSENVLIWGLSTKAATSMVSVDGVGVVPQKENRNNFCSTIAVFEAA